MKGGGRPWRIELEAAAITLMLLNWAVGEGGHNCLSRHNVGERGGMTCACWGGGGGGIKA